MPSFRLNVHAREFVPVPPAVVASPLTAAAGYYSPFLQLSGGGGGGLAADWNFFAEPDPTSSSFLPDFGHGGEIAGAAGISGYPNPKGASPADVAQKIIKQVWKPYIIDDHLGSVLFPVHIIHRFIPNHRCSSEEL
jgi:La-related protein 7